MKKVFMLIFLILSLGTTNLMAVEGKEEVKLYKDFYYGEPAEMVFKQIEDDIELRSQDMVNSYQEWLEMEKYSVAGSATTNAYHYMRAATKLLNQNYICVFRFDKIKIALQGIFLYGPTYDFETAIADDIAALEKMIKTKYNEPNWKDQNEKRLETIDLAMYDYTWQTIWDIPLQEGKKEIKIGKLILNPIATNSLNVQYASVLSIVCLPGKEKEEGKPDFKKDADKF